MFCIKHEKTPIYTEKQAEKATNLCKNLPTYYIDRYVEWFCKIKNAEKKNIQTK